MFRLSKKLAKLEDRIAGRWGKKLDRFQSRHKGEWKYLIPLGLVAWYFAGMLLNSIRLGIQSVFGADSDQIKSIWVVNPFVNFAAVFTPTGLATIAVGALMFCLITKKGYHWFSGYKYTRDKRGFDILPNGTHGTSAFMGKEEQEKVLLTGPIQDLDGTILGKQKDDPDDDDKYAEYVTLKPGCGLTEHIMIYGATGSGKTRGFVKPFILQAMRRRESMVLVDVKGEIYEGMSQILRDDGYEVKMFNLLDKEHSDAWNCLSVIEQDKNLVQSIAEVIIKNTSNANERQDFWEKAELNLLMALMHYVATQTIPGTNQLLPIQQRSLGEIYRILSNESFADLEQRFEALPKGHPALPPYGIFKLANRQIWGNIAIGLGNRLSVFQNPLVDKITSYNEIDWAKALRLLLLHLRAGLLAGVFKLPVFLPALFQPDGIRTPQWRPRPPAGQGQRVSGGVLQYRKADGLQARFGGVPGLQHLLSACGSVDPPAQGPLSQDRMGGAYRLYRCTDLSRLQRCGHRKVHIAEMRRYHHPGGE